MIEPWPAIRRRLLQQNYREVFFLSFQCALHGKFRAVVSADCKRERERRHFFPCPACAARCQVFVLSVGLRKPGVLPGVEKVNGSTADQAMANFEAKRKPDGHPRRKHGPSLLYGPEPPPLPAGSVHTSDRHYHA